MQCLCVRESSLVDVIYYDQSLVSVRIEHCASHLFVDVFLSLQNMMPQEHYRCFWLHGRTAVSYCHQMKMVKCCLRSWDARAFVRYSIAFDKIQKRKSAFLVQRFYLKICYACSHSLYDSGTSLKEIWKTRRIIFEDKSSNMLRTNYFAH